MIFNIIKIQKHKREIIGSILIVLFMFSYSLYMNNDYNSYRKYITDNYCITIGNIESYSISGDADNRVLVYKYNVDGRMYSRKITPNIFHDECYNNKTLCALKKFTILYSLTTPSNSLIDLTRETEIIDSSYIKNNLDRFE